MARSKSSGSWLRRHVTDPFVKQAQIDGYRSRSAYKLIELDERDRLMRPGMRVLDLGSAPGGWSQVAAKAVGAKGRVLATDILPMDPIGNVDFIQGDFTSDTVVEQIKAWLGDGKFDLVVSDIAPNLSGIDSADQARSIYFLELALDTVRLMLKPGANFVAKMFQGQGSDEYVKELRKHFGKISIRKPKASRPESREVYIVAKEFKG
ncbi:MAG: RlmE family RNA methyltransferase [Gammaproteobacteria bacterium]|jgi:23S rRNA (uridine2552-2'-O)-methyltransferase